MHPDAYLVIFLFLVSFQIITFLSIYLATATLSGRLHAFALYSLVSVSSFAGFTLFFFQYPLFCYALLVLSGISMLKSSLVFRWEVCA
jgi:hypothetical protein